MRERHPRSFDALIWPVVILGDTLVLLSFVASGFLVVHRLAGQHGDLAIVGAGFAGVYVLVVHWAAWLGTRLGFKRVAVAGGAVLIVAPLVMSQATGLWGVVAGMGLIGVGGGMMWPNLEAELSRGRQGPLLRRRLSMFNTMWCVGTLVGPLLCGWLYPSEAVVKAAGGGEAINVAYYVAAGLAVVMVALLVLWRARLPSAQEVERDLHTEEPVDPVKLRAFLLMSYVANLMCYVVLGVLRQLYESLADHQWHGQGAAQIHSWLLVLLAGTSAATFAALYFAQRWPYRLKRYMLYQALMVGGLMLVATTGNIALAMVGFAAVGVASSFFYSGSLFYSIEGREESKHMAGWHEMIVGLGNLGGLLLAGNVPALLAALGVSNEEWLIRSPYLVVTGLFAAAAVVQLGIYGWLRPRFGQVAAGRTGGG